MHTSSKSARPYQTAAVEKAKTWFETHDRGVLVVGCGLGKTLISFHIAEAVSQGVVLVFVPTLLLLNQTAIAYLKEGGRVFGVCESKDECYDCPILDTPDEIKQKAQGRCFIISTYQSINQIIDADIKVDIMICDEAHNTQPAALKGEYIDENHQTGFARVHYENIPSRRVYVYS